MGVVNFFKVHKISTAVAAHFTNAGYDTLDTLTTLTPDALLDVEAFNNVKWLPGHKVRLQQIFSEISARVRAYRQMYPNAAPTSPSASRPAQRYLGAPQASLAPTPSYVSAAQQLALQPAPIYTPASVAPSSIPGGMAGIPRGGCGGLQALPAYHSPFAGRQP